MRRRAAEELRGARGDKPTVLRCKNLQYRSTPQQVHAFFSGIAPIVRVRLCAPRKGDLWKGYKSNGTGYVEFADNDGLEKVPRVAVAEVVLFSLQAACYPQPFNVLGHR